MMIITYEIESIKINLHSIINIATSSINSVVNEAINANIIIQKNYSKSSDLRFLQS